MNLISLSAFLNRYTTSPADEQNLKEFLADARLITSRGKEIVLNDYINEHLKKNENFNKKEFLQGVSLLLENIKKRMDYLTRFYNTSLKVDENNRHILNIEAMKKNKLDNNTNVQYKNLIRNLHYQHILKKTESGFENTPTFLTIIDQLFNKNKIDYKLLTPSAIFYMKQGRLGSVFSSYYFRASILNPYLVYSLNENVLKGKHIFTPTLGWSSYLMGFFESPMVKTYVGTDVIPSVVKKTEALAESYKGMYNENKRLYDFYTEPSENLCKNKSFLSKYTGFFDTVFFSPPYFKLELYKSVNQSTMMYPNYETWLIEYWENTIKLCHKVLQKGGKLCYILSGYGSHEKKSFIDLVNDMNSITKKYFTQKEILQMHNKNVHSTKHRETGEKIIIFVK